DLAVDTRKLRALDFEGRERVQLVVQGQRLRAFLVGSPSLLKKVIIQPPTFIESLAEYCLVSIGEPKTVAVRLSMYARSIAQTRINAIKQVKGSYIPRLKHWVLRISLYLSGVLKSAT